VTPGELRCLLERCRADETTAWEQFTYWVKTQGAVIFRAIRNLSKADRDDVIAGTLKQLLRVVRYDGISGSSNAEIHAYVHTTIRNQALDFLRTRAHSPEIGEPRVWDSAHGETRTNEIADEQPSQEARAITSEQLDRAHKLIQSWTAADRYLFLAKIKGVPARIIRQTLAQPPFDTLLAVATVDTRFHRLRRCLMDDLEQA
jgi:DNA-directed RNA polymerase specialized sigma24 family protein